MATVDISDSHEGKGSDSHEHRHAHGLHGHGHGAHHHGHGPHHHDHGSHHEEPMTQEEVVSSLLVLGQVALQSKDYESAVEAYASVLQLEPNETAFYNLGSFRARGLGVRRDYAEAARLFHQAERLGNKRAGSLCAKCMFDFIHEGFDDRTPADLYAAMGVFVSMVYPEAADQGQEVNSGLFAIASTHLNRGEYAQAAKVFRAAAEFGNEGYAQHYLGVLYSAGIGVQKNELAALYWLDRAVDTGAAGVALGERDAMIDSYRQNLSGQEFQQTMTQLADWCEAGTPDVPVDHDKAAQWRELAQER